ncbi:MAG TPA: hypothetical protein VKR58_01290, partial [Aquella sp.]|nr:hypothetical protein [Aquella sp.]
LGENNGHLERLMDDIEYRRGLYFNKFVSFIRDRWCKIIKCGYTIVSGYHAIPLIQIEKEEKCSITLTDAPYPTIGLKCNCGNNERPNQRVQSLQSYANMMKRSQFKCPYCRKEDGMRLLFISPVATQSNIWLPKIADNTTKYENNNTYISECPSLFSDEAMDSLLAKNENNA